MQASIISMLMVTQGTYGLVSGGVHSSGTMNLPKSSNILTINLWFLSNLCPLSFSRASSASCNGKQELSNMMTKIVTSIGFKRSELILKVDD